MAQTSTTYNYANAKKRLTKYIDDCNNTSLAFSQEEIDLMYLTVEPELSDELQEKIAMHQSYFVRRELANRYGLCENVQNLLVKDSNSNVRIGLATRTALDHIQLSLSIDKDDHVVEALKYNPNCNQSPYIKQVVAKAYTRLNMKALGDALKNHIADKLIKK